MTYPKPHIRSANNPASGKTPPSSEAVKPITAANISNRLEIMVKVCIVVFPFGLLSERGSPFDNRIVPK